MVVHRNDSSVSAQRMRVCFNECTVANQQLMRVGRKKFYKGNLLSVVKSVSQ